eukprot:206537_1
MTFLYPGYYVPEIYTNPSLWMPTDPSMRYKKSIYADDCGFIYAYFMDHFNINTTGLCFEHAHNSTRYYNSFDRGTEACGQTQDTQEHARCKSILYQIFTNLNGTAYEDYLDPNYVTFIYNASINEAYPEQNHFNLTSTKDAIFNSIATTRSVYATLYGSDEEWGSNGDWDYFWYYRNKFDAYFLTDPTQQECIGVRMTFENPGPGTFSFIPEKDYVETLGVESVLYGDIRANIYPNFVFSSNEISEEIVFCLAPGSYKFLMDGCKVIDQRDSEENEYISGPEFLTFASYDFCTTSYVVSGDSISRREGNLKTRQCTDSIEEKVEITIYWTMYEILPKIATWVD